MWNGTNELNGEEALVVLVITGTNGRGMMRLTEQKQHAKGRCVWRKRQSRADLRTQGLVFPLKIVECQAIKPKAASGGGWGRDGGLVGSGLGWTLAEFEVAYGSNGLSSN